MVLNPRININVQNNITLTQAGGPGVVALIGTAQWGADTALQTFSSFSGVLEHYKEDALDLTLIKGADLCYGNGSVVLKVIRIGTSSMAKATKNLAGGTGAVIDVLAFSGKYKGTYGNNILVTVLTKGTGRTLTVTDGVSIEQYTNNNATDGYTTNSSIGTAINAGSNLVTVVVKTGSESTSLVDAISAQALTGGNDGKVVLTADYTTAFDNYLDNEDWDILVCPGTDAVAGLDAFGSTMVGKVNTRETANKKYGVVFLGSLVDETTASIGARTASGKRLSLLCPSIKYQTRYDGTTINLNGTYLACAYAGVVASADVEISPTRKAISVNQLLVDSASGKQFYNYGEIETLLGYHVVPVSKIEGAIKVARGVTRISSSDNIEFELNIVRIIDYVKKQIQEKLDGFLGDPNLARIRGVMSAECNAILQQDVLDEVIANFQPTEVSVGASPDTVLVNMTIQPTFAINFINVTLAVSRL